MKKIRANFFQFFSIISVFSVAIIFLCSLSIAAQSKATVRVAPETTVEIDRIELGAIAQISGDLEKCERLKKISLGYAPNVGMTREIAFGQIVLALDAAGFSESEITLNCPEKILVRRAGQEISQTQIRDAIEKSVLNQFSENKVEARITRLDTPAKIQAPIGKIEIRANALSVRNLFEKFSLPVEIRVDGKLFRTLAATVEIEAFAEIFVAAKDLSANAKITESDVRLEKRRLEKPIQNYLRDAEKLRGVMLMKNIANGVEITIDSFISAVVIKSGDTIRIEARSGNLKLIVTGTARSSGKIGDRIAVKNSQSGAIIQAIVVDEGLVKIAF